MNVAHSLERLGFEVDTAEAEVVVMGGGGAALRAAVAAAQSGAKVLVLAKAAVGKGGSTVHGASEIMSMGAAGYGSSDDSADVHFRDTMQAASGFIDPALVRILTQDSPARIRDLIEWGVPFDRQADSKYKLIQSDFGSFPRALGVSGKTGNAIVNALAAQLQKLGVPVRHPVALIDLLRDAQGNIAGVVSADLDTRRLLVVSARAVVLGTGGAHGLFSQQVSTAEMTGDGQAICFRHGAELVNIEFHQFGPALVSPYVQLFSKSCFVLHPKLLNRDRHAFLADYLPAGLTSEDVMDEKVFPFTVSNVSRYLDISIAREIAQGRGTGPNSIHLSFADVAPEKLAATIPNTLRWMKSNGVDPQRDLLDVGIAFQCLNGGVRMMDQSAESSIPGLYVIGELAGGVRGPDRPGGNSLAEGQVFGNRAGVGAGARARDSRAGGAVMADELAERLSRALKPQSKLDKAALSSNLRKAMQVNCLVEKNETGLRHTLAIARETQERLSAGGDATPDSVTEVLTLDNMATTANIILEACLHRTESRSSHYRIDHPDRDDAMFGHAVTILRDTDQSRGLRFAPLPYDGAGDTPMPQAAHGG